MNRLYINGTDFTEWCSGLEDIKETYSFNSDNSIEIGQSSEVVMTGLGYDYWKAILIDDACNSINNEYEVTVRVDSCLEDLHFILKSQGASFDIINCSVKLVFNSKTDKDEQVRILGKSFFWKPEEGFFNYVDSLGEHRRPKMLYVKEMTWLNKILTYTYIVVLLPLITLINQLINIVNAIIDVIEFLGGNIGKISKIDEEAIEDDVMGAGEYAITYYIKDIIEFWAAKAGLKFKSSILQNTNYSNLVLFSQQYKQGIELKYCETKHHDTDNAANITCIELLNLVIPVFNSQWRIIDNQLILETKEILDNSRITVFNLQNEINKGTIINDINIRINAETNCAQFDGKYALDSIDTQSNRALLLYDSIVEYNPGLIHKNRKGKCEPKISFGAARFTEDKFQNNITSFIWSQIDILIFKLGSMKFTHSLVLFNDTAQNFKLIEIDQSSNSIRYRGGCKFRFPIKRQIPYQGGGGIFPDVSGSWEYNYNMWFGGEDGLYKKYHYVENPDLNNHRPVEIPLITWQPKDFCEAVKFMKKNLLNTKIISTFGGGNINSFEIDYKQCTIEFKDVKFKCNEQ